MVADNKHESGLTSAPTQALLPLGGLTLSRDEQAYLAWARRQEAEEGGVVDVVALKEVGLSEEEISFLQVMADTHRMYGTPANCGLNDTSRYLLWDLGHFPKADKATGKITMQSFLDSVGVSYKKEQVKPEDYFLAIRYTVRHANDGRYPDSALLRIFRKVLAWCHEFEKAHGLKEKELGMTSVHDDKDEEGQSQAAPLSIPAPISEGEPRMTDKQRGYLMFLMSTMRNDALREDLRKRLELLGRSKVAKIISALVAGNEEGVSQFF